MKHRIIICTNDIQDQNILLKTLQNEDYEITICSNLTEMLGFAYTDTPTAILLNPDFADEAIASALQFSNDPVTKKTALLFLLPAKPDVPPFLYQFDIGCIGLLLRPYGVGEVKAIVARAFAIISSQ